MAEARAARASNLPYAALSMAVAAGLIALKVWASWVTGSIGLLASLVDSGLDLVASTVNFLSIRASETPPDREHRFGHGKSEGIAGLVQAAVIAASAAFVVVESVKRLLAGAVPEHVTAGAAVMGVSTVASYLLVRALRRAAERTDSVALRADAAHYATDVYTNVGVAVALVAIRVTGQGLFDQLVSFAVAATILASAVSIVRQSLDELLDRELPDELRAAIKEVVARRMPPVISYHDFRTRKAGRTKFVEMHIQVPDTMTFIEAHEVTEDLVEAIKARVPDAEVTIHTDPVSVTGDRRYR